ncbi:PIN domain-containing protein [Phaeodactylibacter xiamenensis]|uniref:PIN domain-containing protein n=1 Tax=Phaeodactylibacter xiamenensis TaxID=1524460 RepID=UPI0024A82482|nr:PIN domain-containing protein [Phaeodactylibacter xiamenensis]
MDTNLLIYAHTNLDTPKQHKIQSIISTEQTIISTQVFKEAANVLFKKFNFAWQDIQQVLLEMEQNNEVYTNTTTTIQSSCQIANRYGFSFYDSLIIASALEVGCSVLYSEDLQHGQVFDKELTVKNPFV